MQQGVLLRGTGGAPIIHPVTEQHVQKNTIQIFTSDMKVIIIIYLFVLTLSGREVVYKGIWSKMVISKTRFNGLPVFAADFAARGEILDRFFRLGSKTRSNRLSFVYNFPSAKG